VLKLLHSKRLKPPSASRKVAPQAPPVPFTEKYCYDCLVEVENVLDRCVAAVKPKAPPKGKGRRKTQASTTGKAKVAEIGPQSASEVVGYALKRGWLL